VGVVLGGGGAKGFAHVGAIQELMQAGVEIDFIGGTSAGALHGVTMAFCDLDFNRITEVCETGVKHKLTSNDYTMPLLSFMSGRKVNRFINKLLGAHDMEDLWINAYTVSSNFSHSGASVHEYGPIKQKVMASIAIPGIFPPVVINNELHVDGGVVNNLPIEPMYRFPLKHIIAISLSGQMKLEVDYQELPSARKLIWQRLLGKKQQNIPGIGTLIVESLTLNSRQRQDTFKTKASLYIELDLKEVGFLDDKHWQATMHKGALQVRQFVNSLPETKKFWIKEPLKETGEELEAF
jgi:predicted acylesterase/phospholipase RssA